MEAEGIMTPHSVRLDSLNAVYWQYQCLTCTEMEILDTFQNCPLVAIFIVFVLYSQPTASTEASKHD